MHRPEVNNEGFVYMPGREDWIPVPIVDIVLCSIDHPAGEAFRRLILRTKEPQQVFKAGSVALVWCTAHQDYASIGRLL